MKKIFIFIITLILAMFTFAGCKEESTPTTYDTLNSLVNSVSSYKLTVSTTTSGETLNSSYDIDYTENGYTVVYSYEVLNKIDLTNPQDEYKSIKNGSATIENGEVKNYTGDEINAIPSKLSVKFEENYFSSIQSSEGKFVANIIDSKQFLNNNVEISNMTITVDYSPTIFEKIVLSYTTTSSTVVITYSFD